MNVLVVGSSLIDLFITVEKSDKAKIENNTVIFTLGDKIPININALSLGGNGGNVAAALQKLDISTSFYTYLGKDILSSHIRTSLQKEGVTLYVEEEDTVTGSLSLIFDFELDRVIFSHHNFSQHSFDPSSISEKPEIIYLTSIGKKWENAYQKVLEYALTNSIPIAISPGSQQLNDMNETFIASVKKASMLFCNMEEARLIHEKISGNSITDTKELLLNLKASGFEYLSITDGSNGAWAVDKENVVYKISSLPTEGKEKTGAGDAYAGAFLASFLQKKPIEECMKHGVINSLGVMSHIGAHTGQLRENEMEEMVNKTEIKAIVI